MNDGYVLIISILIFLLIAAIIYIVDLQKAVLKVCGDYSRLFSEHILLKHKYKKINHSYTEVTKLLEEITKTQQDKIMEEITKNG